MKEKMPWLKIRLRELGKTPTALARELGIQSPRVWEMIGGRRAIQPDEIVPTARFLDWSLDQLLEHLPEDMRVLSQPDLVQSGDIPLLETAPALLHTTDFDCMLTGATARYIKRCPSLQGRNDVFCLYQHGTLMWPWRSEGEAVIAEKGKPPREADHVVVYLVCQDQHYPVAVRQLVHKTATKIRLRQHTPRREYDVDRKYVAAIYRVLTWDDCLL